MKTNLPQVLAAELGRSSWRREQVAVGTATDPYQPAEGRFKLTRQCLEALSLARTPISLVTKGTMVLRDLDVLQELTKRAGATVCFSVPTVDTEIWRRTERGTPPPLQRLKVMERLAAAGIRAGVFMAPLLPGLSANPEQIARTVKAAADHGATFIGAGLLHLDDGIRGYFLGFLQQEYLELLEGYHRLYGAKYTPRAYQLRVERRVQEAKVTAGYQPAAGSGSGYHRQVRTALQPRQLALPLLAATAALLGAQRTR